MQRFWALAILSLDQPGLPARAARTAEDVVWAVLAGDPLVDRRPFQPWVAIATVLAVGAMLAGVRRLARERGWPAVWWLGGPFMLALSASAAGQFPIAPRLVLFALPGLVVLAAGGVGALVELVPSARRAVAGLVATALILIPLEFASIVRSLALEPPGYFEGLIGELRQRRQPGEPVYIFSRSLPAWIWYTTDWAMPDSARVRYLAALARAGGPGFENMPSRGRVREEETDMLLYRSVAGPELLGLPSGMEWREVETYVTPAPDTGWAELEAARIERAARPSVWVVATTFYAPETALFVRLERDAARRTDAVLRGGSALVRYEFAR
jgi:hypothetical protein